MPAQIMSYQRFTSRQGHSRTRSWLVPEITVKSQPESGSGDAGRADLAERVCGSVSEPAAAPNALLRLAETARMLAQLTPAEREALGAMLRVASGEGQPPE